MHAVAIIAPLFLALALVGIIADVIAPRHPKLEDLIYEVLDKIM